MGSVVSSFVGWFAALPGPWQVVVAVLFILVASQGLSALVARPELPAFRDPGYRVNIRGTQQSKATIYGTYRIGGVIAYLEVTRQEGIWDNLHQIILIAGHEIDAFNKFYANGLELVPTHDGRYFGRATDPLEIVVRGRRGTDTQTYETNPEHSGSTLWGPDHRLRGIAYIYARFAHNREAFPNGPPVITAEVRGKRVEVWENNRFVRKFSNNPAWCIRDYLLSHPELGIEPEHLDEQAFLDAARDCEREGYTFDGFYLDTTTPKVVLDHMRTAMAGWYWYNRGKHAIKAGVYTEPVAHFDEDDFRSELRVRTGVPAREKVTTIRGTFSGPETAYQDAAYPEVRDEGYIAQDGRESVLDLPLPFTSDPATCQKIARIMLNRARQEITCSAAFSLKAASVNVTDTITISHARFGWERKTFEVSAWKFGLNAEKGLVVEMDLVETSPAVFEWSQDQAAQFRRDNTNLPNPFDVVAPSIELSVELNTDHEQFTGSLYVDVTYPASYIGQVDLVSVEIARHPEYGNRLLWQKLSADDSGRYVFHGVQDGIYDVRAWTRNIYGVRSPRVLRAGYEVSLIDSLPPDVSNFAGQLQGNVLSLSWDPVDSPGLSHYQLRYASTQTADVSESMIMESKIGRPATTIQVPARAGSYFLKAIDKAGGRSTNPAVVRIPAPTASAYKTFFSYNGVDDNWSNV